MQKSARASTYPPSARRAGGNFGAPHRCKRGGASIVSRRWSLNFARGRMIGRFVGIAFGAGVMAIALASPVARAAGGDDAEKLIRHGIELRKAHDDEGAARAFQQAYDEVRTARAAGQLGLAEQALGRWEDAERHVSEALRTTNDPWVGKNRATLDEALGTIEAHLGRVEVLGDPEGAEVSVNGRTIGKLPLVDAVRVSAGEVDVEMRAPGYVPAQRTVTIIGGQYQRVVLHLAKEAVAEPTPAAGAKPAADVTSAGTLSATLPAASSSSAPTESSSPVHAALKWSAVGLAGAGLAVGVVATILHANNVSKFDAFTSPVCEDNNGKAVHPDGSSAPECQGTLDAYRNDTTWAIVGFASAGAFAVTALVLQLTQGSSHPAGVEHARATSLCAPSLSGVGLSCEIRF